MKSYVAGFMFSEDGGQVALIRKNKPDWQKGKLNGIGGKIEDGEMTADAMAREFLEETGKLTGPFDWKHFHAMNGGTNDDGGAFSVDFFASTGDLKTLRSTTDEQVEIVHLDDIGITRCDMIENLVWLIALARDFMNDGRPSFTTSRYP